MGSPFRAPAAPAVHERPILFSAPMVLALLDGRKTVTRRLLKPQPVPNSPYDGGTKWVHDAHKGLHIPCGTVGHLTIAEKMGLRCPYGEPGDRLLVASEIPESPNDDYCAGSDGRVYSRTRYAGFGRKERVDWYPLVGHRNRKGYQTVSLCHENRKVTRTVHRLVCSAFYGPAPFPEAQVRHLDGDPTNNVPSNLAWGTQAENWQDRKAHGRGCEGEKHHSAKLTDEERAHLRWALQQGLCSQKHAARALGMSPSAIAAIQGVAESQALELPDLPLRIPRLTLEVVSVRAERLHDITEEDARLEGMERYHGPLRWVRWLDVLTGRPIHNSARAAFAAYFVTLPGGAEAWERNNWVWRVGLKQVEGAR
ncbi:HNH endonuclease [Corallococcus exiguus]|uniref:HNH endonuclease n=1 Tax=Corallococcus exiguus TaxID=83462 RepID=UPI001A8FFD83|nr:HNH endonuclease [Corallococcus exiguus]MBN8472358.1 HNH endonuclease [Corallococcus exiguus]